MIERNPLRVLIVEDEVVVSMYVEDLVIAMGHQVIASATRVQDALALVQNDDFDIAILDVNIAGTPSFPVAAALKARGVPFIFATGYGVQGVVPEFGDVPVLQKPYTPGDLERCIEKVRGDAEGNEVTANRP